MSALVQYPPLSSLYLVLVVLVGHGHGGILAFGRSIYSVKGEEVK